MIFNEYILQSQLNDYQWKTKTRGAAQKVFSDSVKLNYSFRCAITGITTRQFLVASHIKPWAIDLDNRLNPANGICLSSLLDKAFDQGFISLDNNFKVIISPKVHEDHELLNLLKIYEGKKLILGKIRPEKSFLEWHRENIFRSSNNN